MKVSLNWIKDFTKIELPPQDLTERISVSLTEVENIENFGDRYKNMLVARVESVEPHPTSDNLIIVTVDTGEKSVVTVVQKCPVKKGDVVPYLPPGTPIPGEIGSKDTIGKVKNTTVKGVESIGMLPSGRELGLNHDHTTVYTIPEKVAPGTTFDQVLDLTDHVIEIKNKALTHRPDAFSIEGIAREISAIQATKFKPIRWMSSWDHLKKDDVEDRYPVEIVNEAKALCPRYMAVVLDDVKVGPSPKWMQVRLAKLGIRPVNNVVDISNYLMMEVGQPSHAFDYDKVVQKDPSYDGTAVITVRMAKGGESITTIDGQVKELYDDTIVIADSAHPIGIAGVMGGKDTEISDETTRVIFQVENLDMYNVRRSSMKLGISSDAVTRFSKGLDPNRVEPVLYRGIQMLEEHASAVVASKVRDHYESPHKSHKLTFSPQLSRARLGVEIDDKKMESILTRLGLQPESDKKNSTMTVTVPTVRMDLNIPQDLDEELVRIYGYDRVKPTLPSRLIQPVPQDDSRTARLEMKRILVADGANEFYTYSFVGNELYQTCGLSLEEAHKLKNPLSPDLEYMRPLIGPSLLEKVPLNVVYRDSYAGFEIDMVNPVGQVNEEELPAEPWHAALVHSNDYFHAKRHLEILMKDIHARRLEIVPVGKTDKSSIPGWVQYAENMYHPSRLGYIRVEKDVIGLIGEIRPETIERMGLPGKVSGFELRVDDLLQHLSPIPDYRDPSKFPSVVHDFSFFVDGDVPYAALIVAVQGTDEKKEVIQDVDCLDVYRSSDSSEKKVTIRVTLQSYEETLDEDEIERMRGVIIEAVEKGVGGRLAR